MMTFGYLGARGLFITLLKSDVTVYDSLPLSSVPGLPSSCSVVQASFPMPSHQVSHMVNGCPMLVLDYAFDMSRGPVVPQTIWRPLSEGAHQRYVVQARL